jgi:hypothetical protein
VIVPVGGRWVPASVSVTVAVQVGDCVSSVAGGQLSDVDVVRVLTVSMVEPLLVEWVASPP